MIQHLWVRHSAFGRYTRKPGLSETRIRALNWKLQIYWAHTSHSLPHPLTWAETALARLASVVSSALNPASGRKLCRKPPVQEQASTRGQEDKEPP